MVRISDARMSGTRMARSSSMSPPRPPQAGRLPCCKAVIGWNWTCPLAPSTSTSLTTNSRPGEPVGAPANKRVRISEALRRTRTPGRPGSRLRLPDRVPRKRSRTGIALTPQPQTTQPDEVPWIRRAETALHDVVIVDVHAHLGVSHSTGVRITSADLAAACVTTVCLHAW